LTQNEWVRLLKGTLDNLPDSPALWRQDNKPVLMMFGNVYNLMPDGTTNPPTPYGDWKSVISELRKTNEFYFIPDVSPAVGVYEKWAEVADAAYSFVPGAPS
jgi:hypothetical protein